MCHTTKDNIVLTLRELMKERPLRKIKVQDVMKATGMTRQSFYYHFQDIYQVIEWEVERKLLRKIGYQPEVDCFQWLREFNRLLDEDYSFYRRVFKNIYQDNLRRMFMPVIVPNIRSFLLDGQDIPDEELTTQQRYAIESVSDIIFSACINHVILRDQMTDVQSEERLDAMCMILRGIRKEMALETMSL